MRNPIRPHPQCTAGKARAPAAGTSRYRADARELQPLHAQNFPSPAPQVNDATAAATVPNTAARHAFSSNFSITQCDAVCELAGIRLHAVTCTQFADGPGCSELRAARFSGVRPSVLASPGTPVTRRNSGHKSRHATA
jgi:hypothetical protein